MRVLLDESVPRQLASALLDHSVTTVPKEGWAGLKNGELMAKAAPLFDAFITGDQNLEYQQKYADLPIGIVVLVAPNNRVETIVGMSAAILNALADLKPGKLVRVAA